MAITPNSVTAYIRATDKQKKVTPPVPPKPLQTPEEYAKAFGIGNTNKPLITMSGDAKTTTGEEQLKLNKQQENIKSRLTQNLNLSPKQRQDLQAETERIALGLNRTLSVGGPTPNFLKKLQNVVVSKIVSPFLSGTKTLATAGGDLSLQKQGEAWGGALSDVTRQTMRVAQSAIKEIEDLRLDKPKDDGIYSLAKLKYDLLDLGSKFAVPLSIAADIQKAGNTKEKLLASKNTGGDEIEASLTDLFKQAIDPDFGIKKTLIAQQNVARNKILGNVQNVLANEITNPWNYITGVGEVQYVGKAGRLLLATKFNTLEMLAKYPALAEIGINKIARFGLAAIPRDIRLAEGINTGLRIVGKPAKFTEPVGELVNFTWGRLRAVVGDISRNATNYGLTVATKGAVTEGGKALLIPASRVASRKLGQKVAGEFVMNGREATEAIASWSARSHAKGTTGFQYNLLKDQAEGWVEEARKAGLGKTLINLVENPDLIKTYDEYKIVLKYRNWRDATYQATETAYKKFGTDFGTEVPDFSWIDDYVHHTMTREVKNWIRKTGGFEPFAKISKFNPAHLSYDDVVSLGSPLKYRSLKIGEEFMGETVQKGTISEINEIFRRQSGQAFDFFETEIGSIADSYSYSMAKQHGREAFTRRLMAFGDDAVQKLLDTTIPDRVLGAELSKVHKGLVALRSSMSRTNRKSLTALNDIVARGVSHAETLVKENSIQRKLTIKQRDALVVKLTVLESNLAKAKATAASVAVDMRQNFDTVHAVLLDDIRILRSEIASGDGDMSEVRHTLQQTYIAMFPNASKVPDDVQVLADRILAARGIPASREVRALNAEMNQIRNMIELTDPNSPEYLALLQKEGYYKDLSNGYRILGEVRATQTYAPDNSFLYTTMTDMGSPDAPFQLLQSEPALFAGATDVVGVHVIPDSELLDSRTSEGIQAIFGSDNFVKSIDTQLQDAGLDSGRVFIKTYYALKQGTPLDPEIERGFPDLINFIESIMGSSKQQIPAGGDADLVMAIYNDFVDIATSIAHSSGFPDADDVGRTIINSALGDVALAADLEAKKSGLLLPARLFDETADASSVVVVKPADYSVSPSGSLTGPVQGPDSPLLQSVMNSDYTTASDVAKGHLSAAQAAKEEIDVTRKKILSRIAELTVRKETIQAGTTAQKTVAMQAKERAAASLGKPRTISIEGKTVTLDRKGIETALASATKQEAKLRANLEANIVKSVNNVRVVNELAAPSEDVLLSIIDRVARDEGLSVRMLTGKPPTKGYMVAKKEFSTITKAPEFFDKNTGVDALLNYFRLRRVELSNKNYLGVWHDKKNGEVVLDVVDNIMNIDEATRLGRERNQQSIWDVVNQTEIPTGGTGGREATTTGQAGNAVGTTPEAVSGDVGGGTAGVRRTGMGTPQRKQGQTIKGAEAQLLEYGDRLTTLFNQAEILRQWSDDTGNVLRQEIQAVGAAMANMPARGEAGAVSREWVRSVQRTVEQTKFIKDKTVGKAYERITELLYVSDIGLAQAEDAIIASKLLRDDVLTGRTDAILAPVESRVLEGWEAIIGLGVQAPAQVLAIWKPNLQKMMSAANRGLFLRGLAATNNMFKTYAVTSVGFVVRNAYSSMFMNGVRGVDGQTIVDGARAMTALNKFGADKWLDELKIVDPVLRAKYEEALKVSITTGLQGSFTDLREPVIGGTLAEKIINKLHLDTLSDKILPPRLQPVGSKILDVAKKQGFVNNSYTGAVRRANTRVEAAVRFPMALDALLKGGTYDDAVAVVTRYHFDYSDVSKLDEVAQQLLPFWIWTTRNIPNQITNQWMRPQAYSIWEGAQSALPVDDNEVIPAWIKPREPMGLGQRDTFLGKGLYALTPDMPHQRLEESIKMLTSPSRLIGSAYPYIKLPFEKYAGKNLGIDVGPFPERVPAKGIDLLFVKVMDIVGFDPIYDENKQMTTSGFAQYARGNINPIVARLQRLSGGKLGGKETYATRTGASWMSELGIPLSIIQDSAVRGEYINRKFKLEDWVKDLISRNLLPKETKK